jgi:hypothetical protein
MSQVPSGLGEAGAALWREITQGFDLRADELRVLEDAAREADIITALEDARVGAKLIVKGSMGQDTINPLISELRQHRSTLAALLRQLKLAEDTAESRSTSARAAANARWATRSRGA